MKDRDVPLLRGNRAQAAVRVAQHQDRLRQDLGHQPVALRNDISHRLAEVVSDCIKINLRVIELQIPEENAVKVVVIILPRVGKDRVEISPALFYHRRKPDDLRTRPDNYQKLQSAVFLPVNFEFSHFSPPFHQKYLDAARRTARSPTSR